MNGKPLTFVADESCDFAVVRALRKAGLEVLAVVEAKSGAADTEILKVATRQGSVLLTEDKDFGEWIFAHGQSAEGVVLIRFPARMRKDMIEAVVEVVTEHGTELRHAFAVVEPGKVRIRTI
jgi:predicted nuclease of predicted toxin-antitoxin system